MVVMTARNARSSLEMARKRSALSRTFLVEQSRRRELQREFGPILDDVEKDTIIAGQSRFVKVRDSAIKRARLNLLKRKEGASLAWSVRNGSNPAERKKEKENFDEVILEY